MSMISYIGMKVTFLVLLLAPPTASFAPAFTRTRRTTELNIIGGAIRKMRAEQEKKVRRWKTFLRVMRVSVYTSF